MNRQLQVALRKRRKSLGKASDDELELILAGPCSADIIDLMSWAYLQGRADELREPTRAILDLSPDNVSAQRADKAWAHIELYLR